MSNQIYTYGSNVSQQALYPVISKPIYECANSSITRGVTGYPSSLDECFQSYPGIRDIAEAIGFYRPDTGGSGYTLWTGQTCPPETNLFTQFTPVDVYFETSSHECNEIVSQLDVNWLGCLWGTPSAPYSCTCPDIGPKYEAYLKHRLNVASFWNTPVETPVKRAEFVDALKYGKKVDVTVAGDFKLRVGQVVNLRVTGVSKYPYASAESYLNGLYYITGIKHVVTNSGTHESALALTQIPPDTTGLSGPVPYYP